MSNPPKGSAHKQESGSSTMATGEKTTRAGSESSGHHWAGYSCSAGEASSPRLPLRHRPPPRDFRRYIIFGCPYRHPKKPKAPAKDKVQEKVPQQTMIASWGMANYVEYNQVRLVRLLVFISVARHLAVVDFSTEQAAESALYHFMGYHLMGRPLKLAWFDPKDFAVLRDIPTRGERMPNYLMQTVCVTGFDSSLEIGTIRHALEEIFANDHMKKLVTPVNLDGTSTGKAYIRYDVASSYNGALHCDGVSEIGGRILRVTKWPDFSWCKKRRIGRAGCDKDDAGLAVPDQDDTPKWHTPSTGKRTLFDDGSGDEAGVTM